MVNHQPAWQSVGEGLLQLVRDYLSVKLSVNTMYVIISW